MVGSASDPNPRGPADLARGRAGSRRTLHAATRAGALEAVDEKIVSVNVAARRWLWNYTIKPLSAPTQPNPCVNEKDLLEWFDCRCRLIRNAAGHRLNRANRMAAAIGW
jgi:hypothetical protein